MQSLTEVRNIDIYLGNFMLNELNTKGFRSLYESCNKILNFEYIEGLDKYSKELLALSLEKRIIIEIERENQKGQRNSSWQDFKVNLPYINKVNNPLIGYISLTIRNIKEPIPIKYPFNEINDFYNEEIVKASNQFLNRMFGLISGQRVSTKDVMIALENLINMPDKIPKEFNIKKVKGKLKSASAVAGLVTVMSAAIISHSQTKTNGENIPNNPVAEQSDELTKIIEPKEYEGMHEIEKKEEIAKINNSKYEVEEYIFNGYECMCPKDIQQYVYNIDKKYNIPFNVHMTILDNESDGRFDTNGVKNASNDYGFAQINECNLKEIEKYFGYTKDEILNDPYKNIEASAFILSGICKKYAEDIKKENYENVFGAYNGWINWQKKPLAVEYSNKAVEKINKIYNKTDEELYLKVIVNGEENGKKL